ncbi:MAG: DUF2240 family protein [Candidatus Lokiarchaeota archaeon]|nr:DUF2240 family protein [Candidatus Lokiarchaeota archaeon]
MNGRQVLLILAHLFRKKGKYVNIEEAVHYLSFRCRYGKPSDIRRLLTFALEQGMISRSDDEISAGFLYEVQDLSPNQIANFRKHLTVKPSIPKIG